MQEAAQDNAAGFWWAQARALGLQTRSTEAWVAVRCAGDGPDSHRVVVTRPYPDAAALAAELAGLHREWGDGPLCVEDAYGRLDLAPYGFEAALPQAVMVREPDSTVSRPGFGASSGGAAAGGWRERHSWELRRESTAEEAPVVREASDADGLAVVERTVVEGFPLPSRLPWRRAGLLPPALLGEPGLRAWEVRRQGAAAGACVSYDDGESVGLYWVATLPEHRSRGVGRALLETVLAAHPGRPAVLTATLLGEPLYRRLGFTERALSRWWRAQAAPADAGR